MTQTGIVQPFTQHHQNDKRIRRRWRRSSDIVLPGHVRFALLVFAACGMDSRADEPFFDRSGSRILTISQAISDQIPLVIAHRGASGYLPEHTAEAAAFAHALGADYIEQDVVLTKDGVAVVLHDVTLDHVTDVANVFPDRKRDGKYFVFDFTLEELAQLRVVERISDSSRRRFPQTLGRFRIMTLAEQIELIQGLNTSRGRKTGLYVEIKQPALHRKHGLDCSKEVMRILKQYGYSKADDRAFIQCFEEKEVLRIRTELKCRLPLIQLLSKLPSEEKIANIGRVADGIGVPISTVVSGASDGISAVTHLVATAHEHALMVHVWTLRTDDLPKFAESSSQLLNWIVRDAGADGVFTDQPDVVLKWRQAQGDKGARRGPFHLLHGQGREK